MLGRLEGTCDAAGEALAQLDEHYGGIVAGLVSALEKSNPMSRRLVELCSLASVATLGEAEEVGVHASRADSLGVAPAEVLEAVLLAVNFGGVPRAMRAATRVSQHVSLGDGQPADNYPSEPRLPNGHDPQAMRVARDMYGPQRAELNFRNWQARDPALAEAVERFVYAGINRREVLSARDREVCSVAAVVTTLSSSNVAWHAKAALRLGATPDELKWAAISQIPHAGFPPVVEGLRVLDGVILDWIAHPSQDAIPQGPQSG